MAALIPMDNERSFEDMTLREACNKKTIFWMLLCFFIHALVRKLFITWLGRIARADC